MRISLLFLIVFSVSISCVKSQVCNLDFEDFTGTSSSNPPAGWIKGPGTNIGASFPTNSSSDPAVGFNLVGEYMISEAFNCAGQICFDWHSSSTNSNHSIEISFAQADEYDGTNWIPLDTIVAEGNGQSPNEYETICFNIPSDSLFAPFNVRVKWEMIQRTSGTYYLENVCTDEGICTTTPTEFQFTEIQNGCKQKDINVGFKVCATDMNGFIDSNYTENITLSVVSGSGDINGATIGNAIDGCLDFLISFSEVDMYELQASSTDNILLGNSPNINIESFCSNTQNIKVMTYNLLNYPDGRDDCGPNTVVQNRWDTLANITTYVMPDVLMVCELQNEAGSDSILNKALNINGVSYYNAANFESNQSTASTSFNNMFYYNSDKMTLVDQEEILTTTRDFNKYTVYINDPLLAIHMDTTFIDFYMAHLKAGSALEDRARRAVDCQILRDYLDARPERNNVLAGDLNFYTDSEDAYQTLISGTYPFDDPADAEGNWDGNAAFGSVCTQSSRGSGDDSYDCGFGGGNDSRFDFILTSTSIRDSTDHLSVVPSSYTPLGNDGSIFNQAINDPSNTSGVPMSILNSMYYMSDHLPVLMDIKVAFPLVLDSCTLVYSTANDGPGSLRSAIACANAGETISFSPDVEGEVIILSNDSIQINKDINIVAGAAQNITVSSIKPQQASIPTVFHVLSGTTVKLKGFTVEGAFGPNGSAIINQGELLLDDMIITDGQQVGLNSVVLNMFGGVLHGQGTTRID